MIREKIFYTIICLAIWWIVSCGKHAKMEDSSYEAPHTKAVFEAELMESSLDLPEYNSEMEQTEPYRQFFQVAGSEFSTLAQRLLVHTVTVEFRVRDVAKTTFFVEQLTTRLGGWIERSDIQSVIEYELREPISTDSALQILRFYYQNNMNVRLPWQKIDTFLLSIVPYVEFLNSRHVSVTDITYDVMLIRLRQQAIDNFYKRMTQKAGSSAGKVSDFATVEQTILHQLERKNEAKIEEEKQLDRVAFSLIQLNFREDTKISKRVIVNPELNRKHYTQYGTRLWNALKKGWYDLLDFIVFIVQSWFILLVLAGIGYGAWRLWKLRKRRKK